MAVAAEPGAPTGCRPRSRSRGTVATGKVPRSGWRRLEWQRPGRRRLGWPAERNGWAGILGHLPGRAAPGSRPARGASASASAVRTRIRRARGGARAPRWPCAKGWHSRGWHSRGWRSRGWRSRGWQSRGWQSRGWRPTVAVRVGTIRREALRRARNCRQRPPRRRFARRQLAPGLGWAGQAPRNRRPAAGVGPESSGLAARTRREPGFPDHPSGTRLYAAALPPARNHVDDSHSTGHFLYSSQAPVQAHF